MAARIFLNFFVIIFLMISAKNAGLVKSQNVGSSAKGRSSVPAMFIFGDSLIENGNNNNLATFAKANFNPYGIDFKGGPTGRFCNGYTIVDTIAELLGLPLIPSHSAASGNQTRYGVNYASAASGILNNTGGNLGVRIPFDQQIKNFENTLAEMKGRPSAPDVENALAKCIFFVGMGSNDYLNNYLVPNSDTRSRYNSQQYADLLVQQYSQQLSRLYNLGARKFVIAGLGPLGCTPGILAQSNNGVCLDEVNNLILQFNANTKKMINNLSANLPGSRFSYIDIYKMFQDLLANAKSYGFTVVNQGCCGACLPNQIPCSDRKRYIFWDAFHPTEAVNVLSGRRAFNGTKNVVYPINIQQLAAL